MTAPLSSLADHADERFTEAQLAKVALHKCAAWLESLASPTLANDPFIRAADWAAKLVREYAALDPS